MHVAPHFDEVRRAQGATINSVDVRWDRQVAIHDRLPLEDLLVAVPEVPWNALRSSGMRVPDGAEGKLRNLWDAHTGTANRATGQQQGNPPWTWDEELLAFDLYLRTGAVGDQHPAVQDLSAVLRSLPLHPLAARSETFRNPNGVARKLADIHTHRPGYEGLPTNGSRLDVAIWERFGDRPDVVHSLARAILAGAGLAPAAEPDEEEYEATHEEGRMSYRLHRVRERDPRLRRRKVDAVRRVLGYLACEGCGIRLDRSYATDGAEVYECHHLVPLHVSGQRVTKLTDVALLCPTCHRVAHRMDPLPTLDQLRAVYESGAHHRAMTAR